MSNGLGFVIQEDEDKKHVSKSEELIGDVGSGAGRARGAVDIVGQR